MPDELKPSWWTTDHWSTPTDVVAKLAEQFGPFDLDPCCRLETAKAPHFYTEKDNGLSMPWFGNVWLNPPYSKPAPWLKKAIEETNAARCFRVVALLPARTDTRWFHELVNGVSEMHFWRGRIKWIGWQGTPIPAPKNPSLIAVYNSRDRRTEARNG